MSQQQQQVVYYGITKEDIQKALEEVMEPYKKKGVTLICAFDASYLYRMDPSDFDHLAKLAKLTRGSWTNALDYHRMLERWFQDQTVRDDRGMLFKPTAIRRSFDKVPNEGLTVLAKAFINVASEDFNWHAMGKGVDVVPHAADTTLVDEIERINVWTTAGGGSLGTDGTTIIAIGNHDIDMPGNGEEVTETGLFSVEDITKDLMGDHSGFPEGIEHTQGEDAMGSGTMIHLCSV